ncbi:MAG: hypothetical protein WBC44_06215 [Planctomycetaceae bacterium]
MSNSNNATAANGQARAGRTVDWTGYPALFQRVAPHTPTNETVESPTGPTPIIGQSGGIREAFLGFCQAALFAPGISRRFDRPSETAAAARAIAAAEAFGFTRDEIRRLGCGLYTGPAAVQEDLRGAGFVAAEIDAARLVHDESGRLRAELTGCLTVPLTDESGHLCDFLLLSVDETGRTFGGYRFLYGPAKSKVVVYGLQTALSRPLGRESLVLVDDVLEGLLLQCRGLPHVAAVGSCGEDLSPRRWEELARLGVATVTLAFRRDERHAAEVRDALVNALRAKTAPQVYVTNPYPGGERSAADVLRRFGKDTCAAALSARSLAFHDKDFGAADRTRAAAEPSPTFVATLPEPFEPWRQPEPANGKAEPHFRAAFRQHLADLAAAMPLEERRIAEQVISAVDGAIVAGDFARASWLVDGSTPGYFPGSVNTFGPWSAPFGPTSAYGPGWSYEPAWLHRQDMRHPSQTASIASAGAVLDRLMKSPQPVDIPTYLAGYAGRETPSTVEWVIDSSARGRLATLCERVIDACERRPGQAFVVVCCEHSEQQIMLAIATHLASRISEGEGLTIEEVRTRFAGGEPTTGFRDKPWLADEAADRLRLWSNRMTFVTCPPTSAGQAAVEQAIETARSKATIGGIYFDSLPDSGGQHATDPACLAWLNDLAARCGGQVFATAATAPVVLAAAQPIAAWSTSALATSALATMWPTMWPHHVGTPSQWPLRRTESGRRILTTLCDWLRREGDRMPAAA